MTRMIYACLPAAAVLGMLSAPPAFAEPYWIAWEGETFPEEGEWNRSYGNWDGPGEGQAYRSLHDGVLTIDSLHDQGVYDYYWLERPGAIDPDPGETFVMEWSLRVDEVDPTYPSVPYDPDTGVRSNQAFGVAFGFSTDCFYSYFEHIEWLLDLTVTREFSLVSPDMRTYNLYVDGDLFFTGDFVQVVSQADVAWGDGMQGTASLHHWDYFRFGVVPEQAGVAILLIALPWCRGRRF